MVARVAVFESTPLWEVHNAETVELVASLCRAGKEVYIVSCDHFHFGCAANPGHALSLCRQCVRQSGRTRGLIHERFPDVREIFLKKPLDSSRKVGYQVDSRLELLQFEYQGAPMGALVASQLADDLGDFLFDLTSNEMRSRANSLLQSAVDLFDATSSLIEKYGFTETYCWNGRRPSDGPIYWAAKNAGVTAFTFVSGPAKRGTYVVSEASSVQDFFQDWKLLESHPRLEQCLDSSFQDIPERGRRWLDEYRQTGGRAVGSVNYGLDRNHRPVLSAPTVCILMSSLSEAIHRREFVEVFGTDPWGWLLPIVEVLREHLPNHEIHVKWHPSMQEARGNEKAKIESTISVVQGVVHHPPDSPVDAYYLAERSDLNLTVWSTVGFWAAAERGIPLVLVGPLGDLFRESSYSVPGKDWKQEMKNILSEGLPSPKPEREILHYFGLYSLVGIEMSDVQITDDGKVFFMSSRLKHLGNFRGVVQEFVRPALRSVLELIQMWRKKADI